MWEYSEKEYIKLFRKILDWEWYTDVNTKTLFLHCLLKANWKPGNWHGYNYDKGQFITSLSSLSKETGLSIREVRTALNHLKMTGEVTDWHDNKVRIITVVAFNNYQSSDKQSDSQLTVKRQSSDNQATTDIRSIEDKNKKKNNTVSKDTVSSEPEAVSKPSGIRIQLNDGSFYEVPVEKIELWKDTYQAVDVIQQLKQMAAWCDANPSRRKTKKGIERFITNWLSREQDRGGRFVKEKSESKKEIDEWQ